MSIINKKAIVRNVEAARYVSITLENTDVRNVEGRRSVSIIGAEKDVLTVAGLIFVNLEKNHTILIVEHMAIEN